MTSRERTFHGALASGIEWACLAIVLGALSLVGGGCTGTVRQVATASNAVATVANSGRAVTLDALCRAELAALGHTGRYDGDDCVRTDAARAATPEQRAELARVREQWRQVRVAYAAFADAHDALVDVIQAGDAADAGRYLDALGAMVRAYEALGRATAPLGVRLPALPGAQGAEADASAGASDAN